MVGLSFFILKPILGISQVNLYETGTASCFDQHTDFASKYLILLSNECSNFQAAVGMSYKAVNCLNCYLFSGFVFMLFCCSATLSLKSNLKSTTEVVQESFSQKFIRCWYIGSWGWFQRRKGGNSFTLQIVLCSHDGHCSIAFDTLKTYCLNAEKAVMPLILFWDGVGLSWQLGVWCEDSQMWHRKMQEDSPLSILIQNRGKIQKQIRFLFPQCGK